MNAEQLDELDAIRAIYEDGASIFVDGPQLECQEHVESLREKTWDPPEGHRIVVIVVVIDLAPPDGVAVSIDHQGKRVLSYGRVEHLPPVLLQATYSTSDYLNTSGSRSNANAPPVAWSVSSCWMVGQVATIKNDLERELADLVLSTDPSEPVLYAACIHVKSRVEALRELVFSGECPSKMHRFLLAYNLRRKNELFEQQCHACEICFELKDGAQFSRLECGHSFCTACARSLVVSCVESRDHHIKCPDTSCRALLQPHEIKEIVDDEGLFCRWTDLTLNHAFQTIDEFAWCPRCSSIAVEDMEENTADCSSCYFVFCTLCEEARHPGVECVSAETKLEMLRKKAAGGGAQAVAELRKKEQELRSISLIEKTTKPCPSCGEAVQKSEGCNKMTCILCAALWCWKCGKQVDGYSHFQEGGPCVLFDEAEILRWERQFEDMLVVQGMGEPRDNPRAEDPMDELARRNHSASCPCCGQLTFRMQHNKLRNHLRCWSCRQYFCGHCQALLDRRGSARTHFGAQGCPQHSTL